MCAINGGITTKYFKLEKIVQQGNLMSVYLFKLYLEILFMLRKKTKILTVLKYLRKIFFMLPMQMIVLSF